MRQLEKQLDAGPGEPKTSTLPAKAETILGLSPAVTYTCRPFGDFGATYISENIKAQMGYEPLEFTEDPAFWADNIHPEDKEHVLAGLPILFETGTHVHEYRFRVKDGSYRWMRDELNLLRDSEGNHSELVGTWLDITDRKQMEEELKESSRVKSEFIATAAHELRTPLTAIFGYAELSLEDGDFSAEQRKGFLSCICEKAKQLDRLIDDLLDISRIESGRLTRLDLAPTPIESVMEGVVTLFETESARHHFSKSFPEKPTELSIDSNKIGRAIENIIGNAVKFSPGGGKISITGELSGESYRVTVEDEGIGMTKAQAQRVFDKFYRADFSNTAAEGLGLGLNITEQIIKAHEGKIWIESEPHRGTKVFFTLPANNQGLAP